MRESMMTDTSMEDAEDESASWIDLTQDAINLCVDANVPAEIVAAMLTHLSSKYKPDNLNWQLDRALATIDTCSKDKYGSLEVLDYQNGVLARQNDKLMDVKCSHNAIKTTLKQLKDAVWNADKKRQGEVVMTLVSMADD